MLPRAPRRVANIPMPTTNYYLDGPVCPKGLLIHPPPRRVANFSGGGVVCRGGRPNSPRTISITNGAGLHGERSSVDSSSRTLDVGLQTESPSFDRFTKVVIKEGSTITATTNQMSSRGGEAPGAAAPGCGRRGFVFAPTKRARVWAGIRASLFSIFSIINLPTDELAVREADTVGAMIFFGDEALAGSQVLTVVLPAWMTTGNVVCSLLVFSRRLEPYSQPQHEAEVVLLGDCSAAFGLGILCAVPDERDIQVQALG